MQENAPIKSKNKKKLNVIDGLTTDHINFHCIQTNKRTNITRKDLFDYVVFPKIATQEHKYFSTNKYISSDNCIEFTIYVTDSEYAEIFYGLTEYNKAQKDEEVSELFKELHFKLAEASLDPNFPKKYLEIDKRNTCKHWHSNEYCMINNKLNPNCDKCWEWE